MSDVPAVFLNMDALLQSYILGWDWKALIREPLNIFNAPIFHPEPLTLTYMDHLIGEALFSALQARLDWLHLGALWTTAFAAMVIARMAFGRYYFRGWSKAQEARKARFTKLRSVEVLSRMLPVRSVTRHLLIKDLKVFLRDTSQWSQLLLLMALVLVYLYNFRVLDLERIPYMSGLVKNAYAFVNLGMAAFVLSAVAVRFVFPAVSAEGAAFWVIRSSPISMRDFLWSKFWTALVPLVLLTVALTVVSNEFLGAEKFLKILTALAILVMTFALVGLAAGMGARYPRFYAESTTQVAGSYGGIAFMVLALVLIIVDIALLGWPSSLYLWHQYRGLPLPAGRWALMGIAFTLFAVLNVGCWLVSMRRGVLALENVQDAY